MTDLTRQQPQSQIAHAIELDVPPPAGIAAVAGQEGWDTVMATVADSVKAGIRQLDRADLLDLDAGPRVAGRPLAEVAGPRPGEQIGIHLRYLVNSRLLTAGELATLRTVSGADPRRIVKEDEHD